MNAVVRNIVAAGAFAIMAGSTQASAGAIAAVWTTPGTGTLNGVGFTFTGLNGPGFFPTNLSGGNYSYAPLSNNQQTLSYAVGSNWTVTFNSPISTLDLYAVFWRGPANYTFSQAFAIELGLVGVSAVGNTLSTTSTFSSGILELTNVTTLSVNSSLGGASNQALTFSAPSAPASVPEPAPLLVLSAGLLGLGTMRRKRA